MALPTKEKTWVYDYINERKISDTLETLADETWLYIKNSMVSLGWTVRGSSNGTTADTSDNWATVSDIVHNSGAHSWIVMRNSVLDLEMCIDFPTGVTNVFNMWVARSAYDLTSPSTTAKPTATTEWQQHSSSDTVGASAVRSVVHVLATDETSPECTVVLIYWADTDAYDVECTYFIFMKPESAPSGWTTPAILMTRDNINDGPTAGSMYSSKVYNFMYVGTSRYNFYCTGECVNGSLINIQFDGFPSDLDTDGGKAISAIGIYSDESGARGVNGRLPDVYWAPAHDAHGAIYDITTRSWIKLGALVLPWDGSTVPVIV